VTDRPTFTHRRTRRGLIGPFGGRQLLAGAMVILVVGVLLVVVTTPLGSLTPIGPGDPQATPFVLGAAPANGLRAGEIPPELTITGPNGQPAALTDLEGHPVQLADLRGKAVWINFWASWCPPCQSEVPILRDVSALACALAANDALLDTTGYTDVVFYDRVFKSLTSALSTARTLLEAYEYFLARCAEAGLTPEQARSAAEVVRRTAA
jgi:thiol-disulfide isomerase/thioredoxin